MTGAGTDSPDSGFLLYCVTGPLSGQSFPLKPRTLGIGRGQPESSSEWLELPDRTVSRHHADLVWLAGKGCFRYEHRSRTNLTRLNGELISANVELSGTTHLSLGQSQLILQRKNRGSESVADLEDYCIQLLPQGFQEHLSREGSNSVGLDLQIYWEPRWNCFFAVSKNQLQKLRREGSEGSFPFRKPVALEVGDVLEVAFCSYRFARAERRAASSGVSRHRNPKSLIPGYLRIKKLGRGNFSDVYLMLDPEGRKVAVKVLQQNYSNDQDLRRSFEVEGRMSLTLEHECLLDVIHVGTNDAQELYIVSEYMTEGSLSDVLKREKKLTFSALLPMAIDLARGLEYLHQRRLVHRDVKPSNIFLCKNRAVLGDFGIVQGTDSETSLQSGFTRGTPGYMAPEHFRGFTEARSDQYALAVVLVEALTGKRMFSSTDPTKIVQLQAGDINPALRALPDDLPLQAVAALKRMLSYKAEERFPTIMQAAESFAAG